MLATIFAMSLSSLRYAICGVFAVAIGHSQTSSGEDVAPRFSVASIKPCKNAFGPDDGGVGRGAIRPIEVDPGRIRINCLPLDNIIMQAYIVYADGQARSQVPMGEQWVRGGPGWIASAYSIDAKPEEAQTAAMMLGPMLQALLEDRFQLRIHRENKEMPAYSLVVAKGGPKLKPAEPGSCTAVDDTQDPRAPLAPGRPPRCGSASAGRDGLLKAYGLSMANLCRILTTQLSRKVVDKTNITGVFDVQIDMHFGERFSPAPDEDGDLPTRGPAASFQDDLQKLGLRLDPFKDATGFVVIDHIERPSEN
jgi:uncharacterized protein (TIGR03435 family)